MIEARYWGECGDCSERIEPGQMIRDKGYGTGQYIHVECLDLTADVPTDRPSRFEGTTEAEMGY